MPRSQAELEAAVRAYVAVGSGLPSSAVIPGDDAGPAPTEPYASVLLISSRQVGIPPTVHRASGIARGQGGYYAGGTIEGTTLSSIEDVWDVQFYREGAHARALCFRAWTASPLAILAAAQRGFTFRRSGDVRQIDSIVSETWEPRAGLDLHLGVVQSSTSDLGRIERVTVGVATDENNEEFDIGI